MYIVVFLFFAERVVRYASLLLTQWFVLRVCRFKFALLVNKSSELDEFAPRLSCVVVRRLFNNLLEPSRLPPGHTYSLFKHGIKPEWEDKVLSNGGEWRVQVPPVRRDLLDQYWVETVLTLIREGFDSDESDDIAGVVVNTRKGGNRIAIWTISSAEEDLQRTIGNRWRQAAIHTQNQMEYFTFKSLARKTSRKEHMYTV